MSGPASIVALTLGVALSAACFYAALLYVRWRRDQASKRRRRERIRRIRRYTA